MPTFFVISSEGESILPDSIRKKAAETKKRELVLYLDANICLDVLSYFDEDLKDDKINDIETIILFCQQNRISVVPKFGVMELCSNRDLKTVDLCKYQEMVSKVVYTFDKPFNTSVKLTQLNYPYVVEVSEMDNLAFNEFYPLLLISYTTLLKLYIICRENNPRENNIRQNLKRFCDWCENVLNTSMASELLLAIKIFGGVSEFRRMIDLDKRSAPVREILQTIWGTAWDFFHIRMLHFSTINPDVEYETYFITQDKNVFLLFKHCNLEGAITFAGMPLISFVQNELRIQYKNDQTFSIIEGIIEGFFVRRAMKDVPNEKFDIKLLFKLKHELENRVHDLVGNDKRN